MTLVLAILAILLQPVTPPADFVSDVLLHCQPVVSTYFVGCEYGDPADETLYAGWNPDEGFITGP